MKARHPVHVTLRLGKGIPSLRHKSLAGLVFDAFRAARERLGVRLVHFSVQSNHLHLLVEADGRRALSRAMQGVAVRLARRLNRRLSRCGAVFADRFHARTLRTPLEVRRALVYVLRNHRHHSRGAGRPSRFDVFSTSAYFDGFTTSPCWPKGGFLPPEEPPVARPRTLLLRFGWRRFGLIAPHEAPA